MNIISKIGWKALRWLFYKLRVLDAETSYSVWEFDRQSFGHIGKNVDLGYRPKISGQEHISIGDNFKARKFLRLETIGRYKDQKFTPILRIGSDVDIEDYTHIGCANEVLIGNGTLIASKVIITDHYHGHIDERDINIKPIDSPLTSKPITIGKNCWIGDNVCIMPGVVLGDNVIVGANAVVTHSFGSNSVIAGCPAKIIKILREHQ